MSLVIETARQERFEREVRRCKNETQRRVFTRLHENGASPWVAQRTGKRVVAAFKKYVTTMDPGQIDEGLYTWSMHDGPGSIAHFDIAGFRSVYWHPALYFELLLFPWLDRDPTIHNIYVYTDGLTSVDLMHEIKTIAVEWRHRVTEKFAERKRKEELDHAREIADRWGYKLVREETE